MKPLSTKFGVVWPVSVVALCLVLPGCKSRKPDAGPSIEFTKIPPATQGGSDKVDRIAGRVHGSHAGEQIVIYARSGPWWVQPYVEHPFVPIQPDSTWSSDTHFGFEYAALLVDPGYHPPPTLDVAPTPGGLVVAVAIVKGTGPPTFAPTKQLTFSGYDWAVRTVASNRGGTYNLYDPDNAWADANGALHMRITKKSRLWYCAQVTLNRSLGYGTYFLTVRDTSHLEPAEVLSMYTFDEWHGDQYYREMDVEISRWGDVGNPNDAQYGVQPFYIPGNVYPFKAPAGPVTYSMRWRSGSVSFETTRTPRSGSGGVRVSQHEFTSGVPVPGQEQVKLEFYVIPSDKHPLQEGSEVVIEKFEYVP
jgi:hypothetical protein